MSNVERVFRERFSGTILGVLKPRLEDCMRIDHVILKYVITPMTYTDNNTVHHMDLFHTYFNISNHSDPLL